MNLSWLLTALALALVGLPAIGDEAAPAVVPADYFAEPADLPFDEEFIEAGQEDGWHWREFRYTSIVYQGEPIRIHAIYALPDGADAVHKVPGIIATHGADTGIRGKAGSWYWNALKTLVPKGYAVLFYDWDPKPSTDWDPAKPDMVKRFTTYGRLDFVRANSFVRDDDFRASLHYQAMMAARRGVTWLAAQPEVEAEKIGAWGASYGGIFTSMLAGIEPRLAAANPEVYTSDFGPQEESYNMLPGNWTQAEVQAWRARFDSFETLKARKLPILYTVGANDPTFRLSKAVRVFAAMNEPKHLLIGPNEAHGYWDLPQTVLFFDAALKGKMARPVVRLERAEIVGREVAASAQVTAEGTPKVEFFWATAFEPDPVRGQEALTSDTWRWRAVEGVRGDDGTYAARWSLPVMRPHDPKERVLTWGATDQLDPKDPAAEAPWPAPAEKLQGAVQVFARVTDQHGAMECTTLATPLLFDDAPATTTATLPLKGDRLPVLEAAVRVREAATVAITSEVGEGQPRATLAADLPAKAVGRGGYVLWNWLRNRPDAAARTGEMATPTKKLVTPFADTVKPESFFQPNWYNNQQSGFTSFTINGQPVEAGGKPWHGALPLPGCGVSEELTLTVADAEEHRLTLVMPACLGKGATMRVSLRDAEGWTETVRYSHGPDSDQLFQFRFRGDVTLRVQMTSQPEVHYLTLVGPSALFLD